MRVVHVRVSQADFGEITGAMRAWVDRNNCWLERFETEVGDGGSVIIRARSTVVHASCRPRDQSPACGSTIANRGAQRSGGPASKGCSAWRGAVT